MYMHATHTCTCMPHMHATHTCTCTCMPHIGAVLTEKELDELRGRLETVASTMAEKGKPKVPSPPSHYPPIPAWTHERPFLTRDFVTMVTPKGGVALGSLPVAMQQHAILDDLLSVLVGMDGRSGTRPHTHTHSPTHTHTHMPPHTHSPTHTHTCPPTHTHAHTHIARTVHIAIKKSSVLNSHNLMVFQSTSLVTNF